MVTSQNEVGLITYPAIVNIATLVIFFVYLAISLYLVVRQGLGHSSPWIWLAILSICRLTQVSLDLAATTMYPIGEAANTSLESGVAILTTMGLTPLFMATSSLLNATTRPKGRRMQWILLVVHIPLIISFVLIVAGGIDPDSRDGPTLPLRSRQKPVSRCTWRVFWSCSGQPRSSRHVSILLTETKYASSQQSCSACRFCCRYRLHDVLCVREMGGQ